MRNRPALAALAVPALVLAALSLPAGVPAARAASAGLRPGGHISLGTAPASAGGIPAGAVVLKVTPSGTGGAFAAVQAAVNAVPDNSATPYVIAISRGTYRERVTIPASKRHLTLLGATGSPRDVIITAADYNQEVNPATGTPYGTVGSATVHVKASDFTAQDITVANTFDKTAHPGVTGTQAVAIAMEGDRQTYRNDVFYGHQDTLLTWGSSATIHLRQYVYDCEVDGDVDFILGDGQLAVDRSMINAPALGAKEQCR